LATIEWGDSMQIIDLSQDIYEGMKVYPGHLKTVQFDHATHEETAPRFDSGFSFQTTGFMLNDNGPTHVASFSHLDPDPAAETIEKMSLDLFYGGDKRYLTEFPGLGESAGEWIVERRIKTFGVDSPTPDNPASTSYPCHVMCRREHITHYENLANPDKVVNTRFPFAGFPLKLQGAHGGPPRAVALID
jgi:kynurenine formamidase